MNLGIQLAALLYIWPHLSQTAQVVVLVVAIVDFLGGFDWCWSRVPWRRRPCP